MVMPRLTQPSLITILREHVEAWRKSNDWSRESMADLIVKAHEDIGGPAFSGIRFDPPTKDAFERMRVNADRIFRWLDDSTIAASLLLDGVDPGEPELVEKRLGLLAATVSRGMAMMARLKSIRPIIRRRGKK